MKLASGWKYDRRRDFWRHFTRGRIDATVSASLVAEHGRFFIVPALTCPKRLAIIPLGPEPITFDTEFLRDAEARTREIIGSFAIPAHMLGNGR